MTIGPTPEQIEAAYDQAHRLYNDVTFVDGDKDINAIATVIATARLEGEAKGREQMETEVERLRAALEIIEASENLLGPELRAIARAALEALK